MTPLQLAAQECAAAFHQWEVGGSDLYPEYVPPRPRPKRPKPDYDAHDEWPAFDEALEHVNWCRMRGMSPQCVADSLGQNVLVTTWSQAVVLVEMECQRMRRK